MNFYAIAALINAITSIILGGLVFLKSRKNYTNLFFVLLSLAIFIWSFGYFLWQISDNYETALFWTRILSIGSTLIPLFYFQWIESFLGKLKDKKRLFVLSLGYIATLIFLTFSFSNFFVRDVEEILMFEFWPKAGFLYTLYLFVSYVCLVGFGFIELTAEYFRSAGIKHYQIKYIIAGTIIGFCGGATNFFLWYDIKILPVGNILVSLYVFTLFYAMTKYRLMDIRIVFRKAVVYFLSAAIVYVMFYLVTWMYGKIFGGVYNNGAYVLGLIVAPMFVALFAWLSGKIKIFANRYLFFSLYSHQETIAKLTDELTNSIDLAKIIDSIVNSIKEAMQLDRAGILMVEAQEPGLPAKFKIAKVIGFNEKNGISLVQDNFLTQYLEKTQKPLVRDELQMIAKDLQSRQEQQQFLKLAENMKHIEASLCLPMIISNRLIGIIVLGSKVSGDAYTSEDLNLLNTLSKQAAIAVDNARLYGQVKDFNKTLQEKVDEQTKELKEAYEIEKQAHEDLKKLDEAKTNFMLVTQHHLRTPLTVSMGLLDLLRAGTFGKISKKIAEPLGKLDASIKKEIGVVNDLLNVSSFQIGRGLVELKPGVSVNSIAEEIINDLKPSAESKNIYLDFKKSEDSLEMQADKSQLKMALQNVIDNAIKYTKKGGVSVKTELENDKIKIEIKDTGIGMNEENKKYLFEKAFHRSKEAWAQNATGKGLGLYLSSQIIKAHGGSIWAESDGLEKGSVFNIELPANGIKN